MRTRSGGTYGGCSARVLATDRRADQLRSRSVPRIAVDLSIMATVAAAIAVAVWIVGAALPAPSAPMGPLTRPVTSSGDGLHGCLDAPVRSPSGIAGQGTICTHGPDVRATL